MLFKVFSFDKVLALLLFSNGSYSFDEKSSFSTLFLFISKSSTLIKKYKPNPPIDIKKYILSDESICKSAVQLFIILN